MTRMAARKRIALVAHDAMKPALVAWAARNREILAKHDLWGTGTTGGRVGEGAGLAVARLKSGPLGGDQQLGAMIADGKLDILIFFTDPLTAMPHDVDVKALLRISTLEQVVVACNAATADFVLTSGLLDEDYGPQADETGSAG
ncbi:methylglyoxal synthase [Tropicimonas sediminicola]|uniref:Methylglyoxal synthase n=1 Tax=Tropicimonas sediminicola TaxID=1031541 RepID=A0A239KHI8_9RHOB|nr:methylglyoxal synthase [Tropicimonas sediminicola]SNT17450.1 methylglyoxal synthase [Tropicimonas sediminicola]